MRSGHRVPVSDKHCTVGIEVPFEEPDISSSDSDMSSTKEPESSTAGARYFIDGKERRLAFRIRSPNTPLPAPRPSNPLFEDAHVVPVASRTGTPDNDEDMISCGLNFKRNTTPTQTMYSDIEHRLSIAS